jgi:spermidine synthase
MAIGLGRRLPPRLAVVLAVSLAVSCRHTPPPAPSATDEAGIVFDQTSPFGRVLVRDEGPLRVMRFGTPPGAEQSAIVRERPGAVPMEYVRYALLGLGHAPQLRRVLMVGLGGGTFTTLLHRARPDLVIDAVEIDPAVVAAARCCFGLREDDRYRVHVADAAAWLASDAGRYDYVFLDAYAGEDIPAAIASPAFFAAVRARLAPGGVVAINVAEPTRQRAPITAALAPALSIFECRRARRDGNLVVYAAAAPRAADTAALLRFADSWDAARATDFSLRALALAATGSCTTSTAPPAPGSTSP